jgi:integrase
MSVKPRGSAFQVDFRWKGERVRRSFADRGKALAWEAQALDRLEKGLPVAELIAEAEATAGDGWTMESLKDAVAARFWHGTPNEVNSVRNAEEVAELLGSQRHPKTITAQDIDAMVEKLVKKGNSGGTINRKLAALSKMMKHGQSRGILDRIPAMERKAEKEGRLRWYTAEEERRILRHLEDHDLRDFHDLVIFLMDTGCRLGEAIKLEHRDHDDVHVRFQLRKGGKSGAVPITTRVREVLQRRKQAAGGEGLVFLKWDVHRANYVWNGVKKSLGITDDEAVIHAFRHTCASRLVQAGVPIQVVQQWLGHATLKMTLRYAHLAPTNLQQAVSVLEKSATMQPELRLKKEQTG